MYYGARRKELHIYSIGVQREIFISASCWACGVTGLFADIEKGLKVRRYTHYTDSCRCSAPKVNLDVMHTEASCLDVLHSRCSVRIEYEMAASLNDQAQLRTKGSSRTGNNKKFRFRSRSDGDGSFTWESRGKEGRQTWHLSSGLLPRVAAVADCQVISGDIMCTDQS